MTLTTTAPQTMPLAELRRRLTVGTKVTLIAARYLKPGEERRRKVHRVQSNALAFIAPEIEGTELSWIYWQPGTRVEIVSEDIFRIVTPHYAISYRWGWDENSATS